ncbi:hypothetical protein [Paraglaciecola marina]|uniref:hypothetical protein n=1 Tax=Paraglaciecola marina TaxID=2500157 RepID=UPI00105CFBFA|nr:hypothetical protein [Paraglaciecola marina]
MKLISKKIRVLVLGAAVLSFSVIAVSESQNVENMIDKSLTAGNTSGGWPPPTSKSFWEKLISSRKA